MSACRITAGAFCLEHWSRAEPRATTCELADLHAEVKRLRAGIQHGLDESREMQAEQRSSVTLAFLQEALDDLLYPIEGEDDER